MKKVASIILLAVLTTAAFSQQMLWSTTTDTAFKSMRVVPVENVATEVLHLFEQYRYYVDASGYSKDGFFEAFATRSNSGWIKFKKQLYAINDFTVLAFKTNPGSGSIVTVVCVTKDSVDMLIFSNNYESNAILTVDKKKFAKWLQSFIPGEIATTDYPNRSTLEDDMEHMIFSKVAVEAAFPGGDTAWLRYVQQSLASFDAAKNGAPPGKYRVLVRFIVSKQGIVSNVVADTNHGYGMEQKAVEIIENGPKWTPAIQGNRIVHAHAIQPIVFMVGDDKP